MKQEIKIVISYDDDYVANNHLNTYVYLNDNQIGFIQNLSIKTNVKEQIPEIDFTFPAEKILAEDLSTISFHEIIKSLEKLTNVNLFFKSR